MYVLTLTDYQYRMIKTSFDALDLEPTPVPSGLVRFKLTEPQWSKFQELQNDLPDQQPPSVADETIPSLESAPTDNGDTINITVDPSKQ